MPPRADEVPSDLRTVVLVEGRSDERAVTTLARRLGRHLAADGVAVLPMGGATNVGHFLRRFGPPGLDVGLAGLCDAAEVGFFQRGLERAGLGPVPTRAELESRGFYVCDLDLEDELIRALGVDAVERVLTEHGELSAFRTFQQQPAQRDKPDHARLRRFLGTQGGRKVRYAAILAAALDLSAIPKPLAQLLSAV